MTPPTHFPVVDPADEGESLGMTSTAFGATKTATVNGTTLAYREQGDGEPVVFVHGGISDLRIWDQQLTPIGESYRAIAYSCRFARPNEPITPESSDPILTQVDDLVDLTGWCEPRSLGRKLLRRAHLLADRTSLSRSRPQHGAGGSAGSDAPRPQHPAPPGGSGAPDRAAAANRDCHAQVCVLDSRSFREGI